MEGLASHNAPSSNLVIPHFVIGSISLVACSLLIFLFPESFTYVYFHNSILSITHLITLGWITCIIFGALYQLVPVIFEVKLFSEILGYLSLVFLIVGTWGLCYFFWSNNYSTPLSITCGVLLNISILSFAFNILMTTFKSKNNSVERLFVTSSIVWLVVTAFVGLIILLNFKLGFLNETHLYYLRIHANIGIIGWFLQLIIGVSSKLIPMFIISEYDGSNKLKMAWYLVNSGLLLLLTGFIINNLITIIFAILLILGCVILFLTFISKAFKIRVRKKLDIGMKQSFVSFFSVFFIVSFLALSFFYTSMVDVSKYFMLFGVSVLLGFITLLIMGQTLKTLPFIVWLKIYRPLIGKTTIPLPKDLYSERIATIQYYLFSIGLNILLISMFLQNIILIQLSGFIILTSVILYVSNILKIVLHKSNIS